MNVSSKQCSLSVTSSRKKAYDLANMSSTMPCIINLVNTAFGVTVLAVPYCLHQCGIILGILLIMLSSYASKRSCSLLLRSAHMSRRRDFESLGFFVDGFLGKFIVEMSLIGYLVGTAIAWFVVIGDVAPAVLSSLFGVEKSWSLRMFLIVFIGLVMILPLSLVKDITSLSSASKVAIAIYMIFVLQLFFSTLSQIFSGEWLDVVNFWRPEGILQCLPIFGISFLIQTVLFVIYEALPEPSIKKMENVVGTAMDILLLLSVTVGFCGYVKYSSDGVEGDLLNNYKHDFVSELIRLGFCISTILSFPLLVFPCRASFNSMIASAKMTSVEGAPAGGKFIPHDRFMAITFGLIIGTLMFGILLPNVEFVMALVGATMGAMLTYVLPSYIFLKVAGEEDTSKTEAKVLLVVGIALFCLSTFSVLSMSESHEEVVQLIQQQHIVSNLDNINTNISLKTTEEIKVKSIINESLDGKKPGFEGKKITIVNGASETTVKDSRKEPILPRGRVLMSEMEVKTIITPPLVNNKVRVVSGNVRLHDDKERAVDDRVRTTEKVLDSISDSLLKVRDGNIGNPMVLRKTNATNMTNVSLASISEKRKTGSEGANNKTNNGLSNKEKQIRSTEDNSRKNDITSKKFKK